VLRQVYLDSYGRWLALKVDNEVASRVLGKSKANHLPSTHDTRHLTSFAFSNYFACAKFTCKCR
jgi:hypothetical protein